MPERFIYFYTLDENNNPRKATPEEFEHDFDHFEERKRVGLTWVGKYEVSTVFLGIPQNLLKPDEPPVLFETMIRKGDVYFDYSWHYTTWVEARAGHEAVVELVEKKVIEPEV